MWNKEIERAGENLRKLYLYQIEDNKKLVDYMLAKHNKIKLYKAKILKLVQCH